MTERPADLPDFTTPPVTEVVLGVQFNKLERFHTPHLGLVWERFRSNFPHVEEHAPIAPVFETFGPNPQFFPAIGLQVLAVPEIPRVLFINSDRTQLLQVQRDRFLHNWRKIGKGGDYPRFERMIETFQEGFQIFAAVVSDVQLGALTPNQCEVSYINQIEVPREEPPFTVMRQLFSQGAFNLDLDDLREPEDLRFLLRYVMRDDRNTPIGRLIVSAEPAMRADGVPIVQLTLTARGQPSSADMDGVVAFLELGRLHMVRGFTKLTSPAMHKTWGRTQ